MRPHEGKRGKNMKTDLRRAGVLNLEMEAATVFTLAGLNYQDRKSVV